MNDKSSEPKASSTERVQEIALLADSHWRSTVQSALRVIAWQGPTTPAPATILGDALDHVAQLKPSAFLRVMETLDFSTANKRGAVRVHDQHWNRVKSEAERLSETLTRVSYRAVVLVALYSYSLHVLAESQLGIFRRIAAYLREELKDPAKRQVAVGATGLTEAEIESLVGSGRGKFAIRGEAGQTFVHYSQMVEAIGASSPAVFHAATVAPTDQDFLEILGLRGKILPFR